LPKCRCRQQIQQGFGGSEDGRMLLSPARIEERMTIVSSNSESCPRSREERFRKSISSSCKRLGMIDQAADTRETHRVWKHWQGRYHHCSVLINIPCSSRIHIEERGDTTPSSRASTKWEEGKSPRDQMFNPDSLHDRMPSHLAQQWMSDIMCAPMAIDTIHQAFRHRLRCGSLVVSVLRNRLMVGGSLNGH
jgi:hypothetical protein